MSGNGNFNTSGYEGRCLNFSWSVTENSVYENITKIEYTLKGAGNAPASWYMTGPVKLIIDGTVVFNSTTRFKLYKGTVVTSGVFTLEHDNEGAKELEVSVQAAIFSAAVNCSGSGAWDLPNIPRASQPSIITWPETTENIGYIGDTVAIHMNRKSDLFTHTVRYEYKNKSGNISTDVTNNCMWTIPDDFINDVPTDKSFGKGTIYVDTFNKTDLIGTKSVEFKVNMPVNGSTKPTVSMTVSPYNDFGTESLSSLYIFGRSKVSMSMEASGKLGASICSYSTEIEGKVYNGSSFTSEIIKSSGVKNITVTVVDSRSIATVINTEIDVREYDTPYVSNADNRDAAMCYRAAPDGAEKADSETVRVIAKRKYYPLIIDGTVNNNCRMRWRYKSSVSDLWSGWNWLDIADGDTFDGFLNHTFSKSQAYTIEIGVIDEVGESSSIKFDIPTDEVNLHLGDGLCVGIGCYADTSKPRSVTVGDDWKFFRDGNELALCPEDMGDYVVSRGIIDGWNVTKWKSGLKECRKDFTYTDIYIDIQTGFGYRTNESYQENYPVGLFNETPNPEKSIKSATGYITSIGHDYRGEESNKGTKEHTPCYSFWSFCEEPKIDITVHIYASGY